MSIRISQRQMYSSMITQMNKGLSDLMDSNLQGATEKRINKPSDDPAGMARVLQYRSSLNNNDRYQRNVKEAAGWLNLADTTLIQAQEVLSEIRTIVQQVSSGTYVADNRGSAGDAIRGHFLELLNIANTEYNGQHIFGGHKTGQPAYVAGLGVSWDVDSALAADPDAISKKQFVVEGGTDSTVIIQFGLDKDGNTLPDGDLAAIAGAVGTGPAFRYSKDGGKTWENGTIDALSAPAGQVRLMAGGVGVVVDDTAKVSAVNPDNIQSGENGTWLYVRPTAIYQGDDHDTQVIQQYGAALSPPPKGDGYFTRDVAVRIDDATGPPLTYSYSIDDGQNWTQGTAPVGSTSLPVPGGFVTLQGGAYADGQQFIVHPRRAEINLEISPNHPITVNWVGKDIFGGLYQQPFTDSAQPVNMAGNVFEAVGKAIAAAETNSQSNLQEAIEAMTACMKTVLTKVTEAGGRENRLDIAYNNLTMRELSETDAMSKIEDIDVTTLMTKLAQQQLAYNTVLKSSSMIMQMNLSNFI